MLSSVFTQDLEAFQSLPGGLEGIRDHIVGLANETPLLGGGRRVFVNLDNAATTPPFRETLRAVERLMEWYSTIHRGTGYKSELSSWVYEECRHRIAAFVGADPAYHAAIFCCNTTHAVNKLCRRLKLQPGEVVLATEMDHHSNLLPWRLAPGAVDHVGVHPEDGSLDMDDLEARLRAHAGKVRLVAVTGASNVTGAMPPLRRIARLAHEHGAMMLVDAAQLVAHRPVEIGTPGDPESFDFLAFSGHKVHAPFGIGILIGPREFFAGRPAVSGGGTVKMVTMDDVVWADVPDNEEPGTPNVTGPVALAKSLQIMEAIGIERIAEHERELTRHLLARLGSIPKVRIYGDTDPSLERDRVAVVPFVVEGLEHGLVAAALGYEYGIGVRNGCFCAHPYLLNLLGIDREQAKANVDRVREGDHRHLPGFVRISLGLYNTEEEIDYVADAIEHLSLHGPRARYNLDQSGRYLPEDFHYNFENDFVF